MKVGIHLSPKCPQGIALAQGFESLGWRVQWRSGDAYRAGEVEPFDAVVTSGARGNRADLLRDYMAAGVPALCIDFGYLKRHDERDHENTGYHQLGLGGLNWVPPFDCPADRWRALGLKLGKKHAGITIIAGQMIGDAAHPFGDAAKMATWATERAAQVEGAVVFRPHPRSPDVAPQGLEIDRLPLAASLARAMRVVAYTSNIGHDALLAGIEAEADGPAAWAGVTVANRTKYFHRLAYAQWLLPEIASGQAIEFILRAHHGDHANG